MCSSLDFGKQRTTLLVRLPRLLLGSTGSVLCDQARPTCAVSLTGVFGVICVFPAKATLSPLIALSQTRLPFSQYKRPEERT